MTKQDNIAIIFYTRQNKLNKKYYKRKMNYNSPTCNREFQHEKCETLFSPSSPYL